MELYRKLFAKIRAVRLKTLLKKIATLIFALNFVVFTLKKNQLSSKLNKFLPKKLKKFSRKKIPSAMI